MSPNLSDRIQAEFDSAQARITKMQKDAGQELRELEARRQHFEEVAEDLIRKSHAPLRELAGHFDNAELDRSKDRDGYHGILQFKHTPRFPATAELRLEVNHDEEIRKLVVRYNARIIPVFIDFEKSDHVMFDLDAVDEEELFQWVDDKVVSFAQAYLKIQFAEEYQRNNLVTDPVAGVRFSKTVAHAEIEHAGHTYYFLSEESRKRFEENPGDYVQL
jgi:YHS domain-containing protein